MREDSEDQRGTWHPAGQGASSKGTTQGRRPLSSPVIVGRAAWIHVSIAAPSAGGAVSSTLPGKAAEKGSVENLLALLPQKPLVEAKSRVRHRLEQGREKAKKGLLWIIHLKATRPNCSVRSPAKGYRACQLLSKTWGQLVPALPKPGRGQTSPREKSFLGTARGHGISTGSSVTTRVFPGCRAQV